METVFFPPRRAGFLFHTALLALLLAIGGWMFYLATESTVGAQFWFYLGACAMAALVSLVVVYQFYSLLRGRYYLASGQIRLVWGLREITIPMMEINWIQAEDELESPLPLPFVRWPGAVTGRRRFDRRRRVEFLSARVKNLVVIETSGNAYAISPEDPGAFIEAFMRITEIGDLNPVAGSSIHPRRLLRNAWEDRNARYTIAGAFLAAFGFMAWIILSVDPGQSTSIALANTGREVTSAQVLLLPVLNGGFFTIDLFLGLFFFRRQETMPLAYLLWVASILTSLLLAVGVLIL